MGSFQDVMDEYRKQLEKGAIIEAYRGLMQYMMDLRTHFSKKFPDYVVSGSIYAGYMDMTYFSFSPKSLKERSLKIAIVFLHEAFRFEVWLSGLNRQVQSEYWMVIKESGWDQYRLVSNPKAYDSILEHTLGPDPDFSDLDALTELIEHKTLCFIGDVERFLAIEHPAPVG